VKRRLAILLASLILLLAGSAPSDEALAQSVTPTADQLDIFKSLSGDQQQAIIKQLGSVFGGTGISGLGGQRQSQQDRGDGQGEADLERQRGLTATGEPVEPIPVLKPDDTVIIEVDFHLEPRATPTYSLQTSALGSSGAAPVTPAGATTSTAGAQGVPPQTPSPQQSSRSQNPTQSESELSDLERKQLSDLITLIRSKNPYTLSRDGVLYLPGFAGIPVGGLIEDLATLRLRVEPALRNLDVRVTKLPLRKSGQAGLKPFGYDLFLRAPSTFAPVTNVPVPADYVIGAGDQFDVQLYGSQNRNLTLSVGRDGRVNFPELGPINVAGQRFSEVKSSIEARVPRQMIGVRASVSMGDTRAIRVFVLGEANRAGSYTISGLGTITSALFAAGGVKPIGSLRNIELKRAGATVRRLDLYDLLIHGNTTDDTKLLPGDVIFVPSVGPTVSVDGEVRRPAIYETKGETTVTEIVELAGGLTPEADRSSLMLTRIDGGRRVVMHVDSSAGSGKSEPVHNGDLLRVTRMRPTLDSGVVINGFVFTPGAVAYRDGMHLSDVIQSVDQLQPNADIHYLLIRRELPPDRRVTVLSADLAAALKAPGSKSDLALMPRDQITVFDLQSGRDRVIQPVLDELRLQSTLAEPTQVVHVDGRVKVPGAYPLEPGMKISDLIRAGGSLQDAAYGSSAELVRNKVGEGEARRTELIEVNLAQVLQGDPHADIPLEPFDLLSIKETPQWSGQEAVTVGGEVRFPGKYAIKRGETLKSVVARAGGLTEFAFSEGTVFTREDLRKREQEELDGLAARLQRDLAILALQAVAGSQGQGGGAAITVGQSLLSQLRATKAVGRLVIDLPRALRAQSGTESEIVLRGGDQLLIPKVQQEVTVIGEVPNATSHLYRTGLSRDDYISLSGGATRRADKSRIYVVHANGSIVASEGSRWFERSDQTIKPGDTIVVPLDTERMLPLPFWQAVTSIFYNVAIAAAAVHSFTL